MAPRTALSRSFRIQLTQALIARLAKLQWTQAERAAAAGLSRARVSAPEDGDVGLVSLDKLVDAAAKIGLTVRLTVARPYAHADD